MGNACDAAQAPGRAGGVQPIEAFPSTPGANATKIQKAKLRELAQAAVGG